MNTSCWRQHWRRVAAGLIIALEFLVPRDTGLQPAWAQSMGFVITTVSACVMVVVTVWFALRDTARAEAVMEAEYDRSEALLANMLPASIAERLKEPDRDVIADKYDDASVLFADIVGFTERASSTAPADLVRFLDRLYGAFDALVDKHGLEKIKVSGDSYMVVSGVPRPRPDHVQALADFRARHGRCRGRTEGSARPLGAAAGGHGQRPRGRGCRGFSPVLLRRVGRRGQRRIPDGIHRLGGADSSARGRCTTRLKDEFVLQERGRIDVKGKGIMRTWYLIGRKAAEDSGDLLAEESRTAHV